MPDAFFGQAIQRPPAGSRRSRAAGSPRASSLSFRANRTITSYGPRPSGCGVTPGGSSPRVSAKSAGAFTSARRAAGLMPSFFGSGVPE